MQRTTLAMPSSDDVTMTRRALISCSSTWKPSISGISISSSSRSKPSRRSISSATRPFSANATLWPCSSRLCASSNRFTLLSSTTSRRACPLRRSRRTSLMLQVGQRRGNARIFLGQCVERLAATLDRLRYAAELQLPRHGTQSERAKRVAVGLERMGSPAELVCILCRQRAAQLVQHSRRFLEKSIDELQHEVATRRLLERFEGRAIDRGCSRHRSLRAGTWFSASTNRSTRIGLVR